MRIFELSKSFPKEETYSLTDQIRRSSRSVCANIAEAWRKRRYEPHLLLNSATRKAKQQKLKLGWNFQSVVNIGKRNRQRVVQRIRRNNLDAGFNNR